MKKTARLCDVCGEEIRWFDSRYKFKSYCVSLFEGEEIKCRDMCSDCFFSFKNFVKQKRSETK